MLRSLFLLCALTLVATAAPAAEVAYPPGSRIGLVPPAGLTPSRSFLGFEDANANVAIVLGTLPGNAYADLERSLTPEALKSQGITLVSRENVALPTGNAVLVIGQQEANQIKFRKWLLLASAPPLTALVTVQVPEKATAQYSDPTIRAALTSLAVRAEVPANEQLGLLPFHVAELAGFRIAGVIPGRALMLSDAAADTPPVQFEAHMYVTVASGGPANASERDHFARDALATVPNLKEVRITTSEPLRIAGQQGHQIIADAKDASGGVPLTLAQWLRFGGGGYMQMIGISRAEAWKEAYPRFRSVRDSIDVR
ncbi:MAG: hypothetical protein ACJ8F3_03550 [Xanthobacteraceae bacterium]